VGMRARQRLQQNNFFVVAAIAVVLAACGSSRAAAPPQHEASLPPFTVPSREDVIGMLDQGRDPDPIDVSASVFDFGSTFPKTAQPEWQAMIATLAAARATVEKDGFVVEVIGYADSTGALPGNLCLSRARADATRQKLIEDAGYPADTVASFAGGVAGDTPAARRVEVKIVKTFDRALCPADPNLESGTSCC
jgi:outer membrane protein OmpA-like peptidoglycan-associated protein